MPLKDFLQMILMVVLYIIMIAASIRSSTKKPLNVTVTKLDTIMNVSMIKMKPTYKTLSPSTDLKLSWLTWTTVVKLQDLREKESLFKLEIWFSWLAERTSARGKNGKSPNSGTTHLITTLSFPVLTTTCPWDQLQAQDKKLSFLKLSEQDKLLMKLNSPGVARPSETFPLISMLIKSPLLPLLIVDTHAVMINVDYHRTYKLIDYLV